MAQPKMDRNKHLEPVDRLYGSYDDFVVKLIFSRITSYGGIIRITGRAAFLITSEVRFYPWLC